MASVTSRSRLRRARAKGMTSDLNIAMSMIATHVLDSGMTIVTIMR